MGLADDLRDDILSPEEQEQLRAQKRRGNALMAEEARKRNYSNVIKAQSKYAASELFRREQFRGEVYDCRRMDDGIIEAAVANGNPAFVTSLDFLDYTRGCTHVVTEPRVDLGEAYARKALSLVTGKVALLLPVAWMTTPETKKLFDETPITRIYVLTRRLRYRKGAMAWYVFERGHFEGPKIRWI